MPPLSKVMIIILHGNDTYRSARKLKEIISGYRDKNTSGINLIFMEKASFNELKDESGQMGMFMEKRLVVGKGLLKNKDLRKKIEENLEDLAGRRNILILKEEKKIKGKLVKKAEGMKNDKVMIKEYRKLKGKKLQKWYEAQFSKESAKIKKRALKKMVEYVGDDLWRASNEINKLANMKRGSEITVDDVREHVKPELETDIFKTIDALGKGDKAKAVELIQKHIQKGDSPFYLLSMINYQLRNLLILKELQDQNLSAKEMRKKSGMSPFVFKKTGRQTKNFSFDSLKKIHQELFKMDLDIKLGRITPETALMMIVSHF